MNGLFPSTALALQLQPIIEWPSAARSGFVIGSPRIDYIPWKRIGSVVCNARTFENFG
jgi:hypothetical protein